MRGVYERRMAQGWCDLLGGGQQSLLQFPFKGGREGVRGGTTPFRA